MSAFLYRTIRSNRRTIAIEVGITGEVIVRAPYNASKQTIHAFVESKRAWVLQHVQKAAERSLPEALSREAVDALVQKAHQILPQKVQRFAMQLGVFPQKLRVSEARKQYGSCSSKKNLSFSCFLMLSPDEAIDYVVVHELCHLVFMNHSKAFYAMIASVLPDWKHRKTLLVPIPLESTQKQA